MAGRDTRVAPRVLRPIHRSLRVVPFGGVDISRRKPFLIIGVASRRRPRARYVAGPKSPAKRGGKILLRGARSDARARQSGLPPVLSAERRLRPAHPVATALGAVSGGGRGGSVRIPPGCHDTIRLAALHRFRRLAGLRRRFVVSPRLDPRLRGDDTCWLGRSRRDTAVVSRRRLSRLRPAPSAKYT